MDYEIVKTEVVFQGFFRIDKLTFKHQLFAGGWSGQMTRELFERGNAAAVLPYDPNRDEVVLIEQFRVGAHQNSDNPWLMEVVAGVIEPGESAQEVAKRESLEESGCSIDNLEFITHYFVSPGGTSERCHLFCASVDSEQAGGLHGLAEENEDIKVHVVKRERAMQMIEDGTICSAAPIIALQWLALNLESIRSRWAV